MKVLQNTQNFRVQQIYTYIYIICECYIYTRTSTRGQEVIRGATRTPVLWHGLKELNEVLGTGMNVVQSSRRTSG